MSEKSETEETAWRHFKRNIQSARWWCAPLILLLFFGFLAVGGTISIFVMGYNPRPIDWGQYALYCVGAVCGGWLLWTEWRKKHPTD